MSEAGLVLSVTRGSMLSKRALAFANASLVRTCGRSMQLSAQIRTTVLPNTVLIYVAHLSFRLKGGTSESLATPSSGKTKALD